MLDALSADLRFAARLLWKSPGFTTVAVATLALGIGANTAIFSVVDYVLLRPLPYSHAERLYAVHEVMPKFAHIAPLMPVNVMHFTDWRRNARAFEHMSIISGIPLNLTGAAEPQQLNAARVSPSLFWMLGVQAQLGRTFFAEEDRPGRDRVVVLDDALWRTRFGADPGIVGRRLVLDGNPHEVVGVLPASFTFPKISRLYVMNVAEARPQLWKPFAATEDELKRDTGDFNYACIVSLKPGVSSQAAESELNARQASLMSRASVSAELFARLVPLQAQITGRSRAGLQLLFAAVGLVLLIGCVNIANLLLARATVRQRELAVRSALGASGRQLARQLLVESVLLSLTGGGVGVLLAYVAVGGLAGMAPADVPRIDEVTVDWRVLLFTCAVSVGAGLLFGLIPAWRCTCVDPQHAMKSAARGASPSGSGGRLRGWLVGTEVVLSTVCLTIGGLLLHSLVKLTNVDVGFQAARVISIDLTLPDTRYPETLERVTFAREALRRLRAVPGVQAAGLVNKLPLSGEGGNNLVAPDGAAWNPLERPLADVRQVDQDYFRVMSIPLRSGRLFAEADGDRRVVLVSASTAERLWPGKDPIGRRLVLGPDGSDVREVTGVVGDVRSVGARKQATLTVYMPYWQKLRSEVSLVSRTTLAADQVAAPMRAAIWQVDRDMSIAALRPMDDLVRASLAQDRFQTRLVLLFGVAAALLACLGIFGVVSYSVAQRTNELGIRLALGAPPRRVRALVLRQSLMPVFAGVALGLPLAVAAGRLAQVLLFGISPADPLTMTGVVLGLTAMAAAGTWVPSARATRVDPVTALREE